MSKKSQEKLMAQIAAIGAAVAKNTEVVTRWNGVEPVSVNDITSQARQERAITMNDSQRITALSLLEQAEAVAAVATTLARKQLFWKTKLGIVSISFGILTSVIIVIGQLYSTFFGLSHSVLGH